jgi:two-component system NtrC family sensor kinase
MFSADGIEYFNRAGAALFGYEVGEIVGRLKPTDLVHPEDRPLVARHIEARLGGAAETARYEFRGRRKNGSPLHCEVFGRRVLLDGRPVVLGVLIDITERKEAEAELRRVNRALRELSQCNQALVRATDEADLPLAICRTVVEGGGYRFAWVGLADAERGAAVRPVAHAGHEAGYLGDLEGGGADPERTGDPVVAALRSVRPCVVSNIREHPGADLWRAEALRRDYASLIALPLVGEDRAFGVLAIYAAEPDAFQEQEVVLLRELAEDLAYGIVTLRARAERQRTEAELQRQREMLYQTEKLASMSQLRAGVAHELNNPLSVMIGRAGLLRQQVGEGPLAGQAEQIAEAAERCARIVRNFLALARQRPPERQRVLLNQVVREAVELLGYQLRVDSVEVELALAEELPALWADPHQLHQVVVNLVSNAHQAMRAGAGPRRLTLATRAEAGAGRVVLEVNDTGPGIPPEIQARIFEPFFTTKPPGQGTGLGLSLCQSIVEGHGGAIRVESRPGGGARFTVELPVEAPQRADQARVAEQWTPVRNKDVLVVDDEADLADLLADILSADGHRVDTASNGAVALSKLRERVYDLILTDLRMPDMDGPAFYRELERSHPDLARRVVFMTGDVHTASVREFLETAAAPTLAKPFEPDEVRRVAARVLRARAQTGR